MPLPLFVHMHNVFTAHGWLLRISKLCKRFKLQLTPMCWSIERNHTNAITIKSFDVKLCIIAAATREDRSFTCKWNWREKKEELKHDINTKWIGFTAINQSINQNWNVDIGQTLSSDKIPRQFDFSFCVRAFDCVCSIVHRPECNSIVYSLVVWIESTT